MHSTFIALATALVVGVATPTLAAVRHYNPTLSYNTSEALAVGRGSMPGQGSGSNPYTQYNAFMRRCLAGEIAH
jgi:hypothetical protein